LSIRDLIRALRRHAILVLACVVVGVGTGAYLAYTAPASYTAQTRLFVSSNGSDSTDSLLQNSNLVLTRVPSYVTLVNSPLVVNKVVERLGLNESPESVAQRIQATNPLQTALIEITVRDTTARGAYNLAASIAEVVISVVQSIETSSTGFVPVKLVVVSRPDLPTHPDLAAPAWRLGLGLLLGLAVGAAVAVGRELVDSRLKDPEDLRTKLGVPPLATIVTGRRDQASLRPDDVRLDDAYWSSPGSEGFRQLRTNLQVLVGSAGLRSILVTGPYAADGAPTVALRLAIALGMAKVRVLLVDADMRQPRLAAALDMDASTGLSAVLAGDEPVDAVIQPWRAGTIHVLPAGGLSGNPSELLASEPMEDLLRLLERQFDLLILNAPPLLDVADAAVLATRVDGVVLTARHRGTSWQAVWQAVQALHDVQARVLGAAVLSRSRVLDVSLRDALRAPVAASRWATAAPRVPTPRVSVPRISGAPPRADAAVGYGRIEKPTGRFFLRSLRPVPDPERPAPGTPDAPPAQRKGTVHRARGFAPARGIASVDDNNRVQPQRRAAANGDGTQE
jgi:succinoglycan biosynthesis transport protein ExoP